MSIINPFESIILLSIFLIVVPRVTLTAPQITRSKFEFSFKHVEWKKSSRQVLCKFSKAFQNTESRLNGDKPHFDIHEKGFYVNYAYQCQK